jgi:4-diphosphocytidyl-2-C-methyl-D-erythritol kinase
MNEGKTLRRRAFAKINLGLEITGRRAGGYHDLATIFQTIDLADEITVALAPIGTLTLAADPALGGTQNLVLRAARALAAHSGAVRGAALTLTKGVPVAAGCGGGSSDAAATLIALREMWALPTTDDELATIAARLGADVPFFLRGGTALATGIGERLTPLPPQSKTWFVLVTPRLDLPADKTRRLYGALEAADFGDGTRTLDQAARLRRGEPLDPALLANSFAAPLARLFPALAAWEARLLAAGAPFVQPSGSGPTLYTIAPSQAAARAIARALAGTDAAIAVARSVKGRTA